MLTAKEQTISATIFGVYSSINKGEKKAVRYVYGMRVEGKRTFWKKTIIIRVAEDKEY